MEARDNELKKDLDATVHARKELGPEYEAELIESFLEKVEQRLDGTLDQRMRRRLAEHQMVVARGAAPAPARGPGGGSTFGERFGFGIVSLVLAVPLSAIGAVNAGLPGLLVTWAGIVGVNAVHGAGRLPWQQRREKPDGDWD
ncbi:hypothetical protein [Streptomyces sp. NPDC047108]|uniref:hypothetical protein n=1 Tax=Streptomyces sp. NPDC047108 TaxID=3155025 RepID=UPI0033C3951F